MDPLEIARENLDKSRNCGKAIPAQAYALDSIAASLLVIARATRKQTEAEPVTDDHIELIVRRVLDGTKTEKPTPEKETK